MATRAGRRRRLEEDTRQDTTEIFLLPGTDTLITGDTRLWPKYQLLWKVWLNADPLIVEFRIFNARLPNE